MIKVVRSIIVLLAFYTVSAVAALNGEEGDKLRHAAETGDRQALNTLRQAAHGGDPVGQNELGLLYAAGLGVSKDDAEAVKWFRKAAVRDIERLNITWVLLIAPAGASPRTTLRQRRG